MIGAGVHIVITVHVQSIFFGNGYNVVLNK